MTENIALNIDADGLLKYLVRFIPDIQGPITAEKFSGGQSNPTYLIQAVNKKFVLRRKPPGQLLKSAHAIDREFTVMNALSNSSVPVAQTFLYCNDESVLGSEFYLMEFIDGRVFWDPALSEQSEQERRDIYNEMNRVLATLHSLDPKEVGLENYGRAGNYFERQLGRWTKQYQASEAGTIESMDILMAWLPKHMPEDDGRIALVHGDFRLDNMMFHPKESKVLAVVDWELSTLGHPFADLAYQCMQLRMPEDAKIPGLGTKNRKLLGIPSEDDYVASYCERMEIDKIPNWNFYLAFSFFRFAAILQGVKKRALDGNASNKKAMALGNLVCPLADMAVDLI